MITKKEEQEFKKPKLYKIWNFLIGIAIFYGVMSLLLLGGFAYITFKIKR